MFFELVRVFRVAGEAAARFEQEFTRPAAVAAHPFDARKPLVGRRTGHRPLLRLRKTALG